MLLSVSRQRGIPASERQTNLWVTALAVADLARSCVAAPPYSRNAHLWTLELRIGRLCLFKDFHVLSNACISANHGVHGREQILQGRKTVALFEDFYQKTLNRFFDHPMVAYGHDRFHSRVCGLGRVYVSQRLRSVCFEIPQTNLTITFLNARRRSHFDTMHSNNRWVLL
ncbi:hypothetical protein OS493_002831 [Desmophyllum pertusum]|uniref:Uncharacterized protein n=1 Tax=Desmophyllum pertusum TaxID=174260 RepID=A0A9W9YFY5_9CNID|nr:hypothetical protein OS493_002831 [Desmophyllum pertusum]